MDKPENRPENNPAAPEGGQPPSAGRPQPAEEPIVLSKLFPDAQQDLDALFPVPGMKKTAPGRGPHPKAERALCEENHRRDQSRRGRGFSITRSQGNTIGGFKFEGLPKQFRQSRISTGVRSSGQRGCRYAAGSRPNGCAATRETFAGQT